jgi:hypothetical protein
VAGTTETTLNMKQPKKSAKRRIAATPLDTKKFPAGAQTRATAGRDKVREEAHRANVPRQSQRGSERSSKGRGGS